jgi:MFS family permease
MILIGLGAGLGFPSLMTLAMSGAMESDSGLASGLVNTSVQVAGAIGLAVLATLATERTDNLVAEGEPAAAALNSGYHLAYVTGAGLVLVAIAVAVSFLRARAPEGAPEPEPVPEGARRAGSRRGHRAGGPSFRVKPLPAYAEAQVAGCQETAMRVVIGCGGCAASAP